MQTTLIRSNVNNKVASNFWCAVEDATWNTVELDVHCTLKTEVRFPVLANVHFGAQSVVLGEAAQSSSQVPSLVFVS
jgi:hypothetical protein